ncbi:glyoxylase-like metal-dependent hydrolase (beta-lactamase superfamily II) [Chelatococcus asaccharovorans]|uniref:Glyoxylase-like metal-dependent hydrolase (Beta-lactamase superfamily II) n=2 Tax=Chelatococcus asaccharovorans TaxID=28210 RepID=A0A2V3TX02_9HYPH|nr:glyoxylase-like metal-dependent hydrolase (beta-lactamase superfamily II) [Chelatococcus asaccharovorans]
MDSMAETLHYEVFAFRYATTGPQRRGAENFIAPPADLHDMSMPLDYYIWAIRGAGRTVVVDTGFGVEAAARRGRQLLHDPVDLLRIAGIEAETVQDVVLTHMHYDHAGRLDAFPSATFHLQEREMSFATGKYVCHAHIRAPFDVDDVTAAVRLVYGGRMRFHNGDATLLPGITLHRIGGHSDGLQVVRVETLRGPLVLASDAFHFSQNRLRREPFPIVLHIGDMLEGHRMCEQLAGFDESLLIPGHDPDVLRRWPALTPACRDIVRIDVAPLHE